MTTSRVSIAAKLLDEHLSAVIRPSIALSLEACSSDIGAIDALNSILGHKSLVVTRVDGTKHWRCQDEEDCKKLLEACMPYMIDRVDLAQAALNFLAATTPSDLLVAIREIEEERRLLKWTKQQGG